MSRSTVRQHHFRQYLSLDPGKVARLGNRHVVCEVMCGVGVVFVRLYITDVDTGLWCLCGTVVLCGVCMVPE